MNLPIEYRDYIIDYNQIIWGGKFSFVHQDYDGAPDAKDHRHGFGNSVEDCKRKIDEYILENETYEVQSLSGKVEEFYSFIEAVRAAIQSNGILRTTINSI